RYWKDPYAFKPSRFMDPGWPRDAFIPFSAGPRACIGKRFAEVEAIAIISLVVKRYKITVDERRFPTIPGENVVERRERLFATSQDLTLTPTNAPLVLTRRRRAHPTGVKFCSALYPAIISVTGPSGEDSPTAPSPPKNKMDDKPPSSSALSPLSPIFVPSKLMITTNLPAEPADSLEKCSRSQSGSESAHETEVPRDIHKDTGTSTNTTSGEKDWEHDVMMEEEGNEDRRLTLHASSSASKSQGPTDNLDTPNLPKRIVLRLPPVYGSNGGASKKSALKREREEEDKVDDEKAKKAKLTLGGRAHPKGVLKTSLKTSRNGQRRVQWARELEEWKVFSSESEWDYDEYEDDDDFFDSPWLVTKEDEGDEDGSENDDRSPSPSASWPNDVMTTLSESGHRILAEALDDLEDFFSPKPVPVIRHSLRGLNNSQFEKRAFRPQASSRFAKVDAGVPKASGSEENRTTA
ncbi:hypothetical protein FRB90_008324, partial [Tulasnella sp. 427]